MQAKPQGRKGAQPATVDEAIQTARYSSKAKDVLAAAQILVVEIGRLRRDRLLLAKLGADTPQFFNPLEAMAAKLLRAQILAAAREGGL